MESSSGLKSYLFLNKSNFGYLYAKGESINDALTKFEESCEIQGFEFSEWLDDYNYEIIDVSNNIGVFYMLNLLDPKQHKYTTFTMSDKNFKLGDYIFTDKTDISKICFVKAESIEKGYEAIHTILKSNDVEIPEWLQPNSQTSDWTYCPVETNMWARSFTV
jgi:hypothetical protein